MLAPWTPIEGRITERECEHIRALYMEKITQVDKWVGELLDSIRAQGLWDETLIVLMSDHGQPATASCASAVPGRMRNSCTYL